MKDLSLGKKLLTSPLILVSNSQRIPCVDQHTELHGGVIIETLVPPSFSFARYDWGFLNCYHLVYKFNYTLISETSIFISKEKKKDDRNRARRRSPQHQRSLSMEENKWSLHWLLMSQSANDLNKRNFEKVYKACLFKNSHGINLPQNIFKSFVLRSSF